MLFEESNFIADGYNRFRIIVGNFTTKFLFEIHYYFNPVEAVGVEIVNEACTCHDLVGVYRKLLDYKFFDPLGDISHVRRPPCYALYQGPLESRRLLGCRCSRR
jgi:hypothetical protein